MVEVGDPGFVAPIKGGRFGFVPVEEPEIGDVVYLLRLKSGRWGAVPQFNFDTGAPAMAMPRRLVPNAMPHGIDAVILGARGSGANLAEATLYLTPYADGASGTAGGPVLTQFGTYYEGNHIDVSWPYLVGGSYIGEEEVWSQEYVYIEDLSTETVELLQVFVDTYDVVRQSWGPPRIAQNGRYILTLLKDFYSAQFTVSDYLALRDAETGTQWYVYNFGADSTHVLRDYDTDGEHVAFTLEHQDDEAVDGAYPVQINLWHRATGTTTEIAYDYGIGGYIHIEGDILCVGSQVYRVGTGALIATFAPFTETGGGGIETDGRYAVAANIVYDCDLNLWGNVVDTAAAEGCKPIHTTLDAGVVTYAIEAAGCPTDAGIWQKDLATSIEGGGGIKIWAGSIDPHTFFIGDADVVCYIDFDAWVYKYEL